MDKYYVQMGKYKRVMNAEDAGTAAMKLVQYLVEHTDRDIEFAPVIVTSQAGYADDIMKYGRKSQYDNSMIFYIPDVLHLCGYKQLAKSCSEHFKEQIQPNTMMSKIIQNIR